MIVHASCLGSWYILDLHRLLVSLSDVAGSWIGDCCANFISGTATEET